MKLVKVKDNYVILDSKNAVCSLNVTTNMNNMLTFKSKQDILSRKYRWSTGNGWIPNNHNESENIRNHYITNRINYSNRDIKFHQLIPKTGEARNWKQLRELIRIKHNKEIDNGKSGIKVNS